MATFKSSSSPWKVGVSRFRFDGKGKVAIKMEVWTPEKTVEEKFIFEEKLLPPIPVKITDERDGGEYYVALKINEFGLVESVESIRPYRYTDFLVIPVDMTRSGGDENTPGEPQAFGPDSYGRMKINVFLEVQEPEEYKGVKIKFPLLHKFCDDGNGQLGFDFTLETLHDKKSRRIQEFFNFWTNLTGAFPVEPVRDSEGSIVNYKILWPMDLPDDGNPYPELLARLKDKKPYLKVSGRGHEVTDIYAEKGYKPPVDVAPIPDEEPAPSDIEDDTDPFKGW